MDPYLRGLVLPDYLYRNGYWVWSNREVNHRGLGRRSRTPIQAMPSTVRANPVMKQIIRLEPAAKIMLDSSSDNHLLFSVYPVFKAPEPQATSSTMVAANCFSETYRPPVSRQTAPINTNWMSRITGILDRSRPLR